MLLFCADRVAPEKAGHPEPLCCTIFSGTMAGDSIMKTCIKCHQEKSLPEFNKAKTCKDGHRTDCRVCRLKYLKEYNQTNKAKDSRKCYRQTEKGKAANKRYYLRYPERCKAKSAVSYAIEIGKLPRTNILQCHYCPNKAKEYHHHKGYSFKHWLDVIPICISCHRKIHTRSA